MSESQWWDLIDTNWDVLKQLIETYHPSFNKPVFAKISAPNVEIARREIERLIPQDAINLETRDSGKFQNILIETWMGIPESRELVNSLTGFDTLCTLMEGWEHDA